MSAPKIVSLRVWYGGPSPVRPWVIEVTYDNQTVAYAYVATLYEVGSMLMQWSARAEEI